MSTPELPAHLPGVSAKQRAALEDWTLRKSEALTPEFTIIIEIYQRKLDRQQYRWRAKRIGNNAKMANGGEAYVSTAGLLHALKVLWPSESGNHIVVHYPSGAIVPLSEVQE